MSVRAIRIHALAAKIETTEGTSAAPTFATDAVRIVGYPLLRPQVLEEGKRTDVNHGGLGSLGRVAPGGRWGEIDVTLEIRGKGTAYAAVGDFVEAEPFWRAAGFAPSFAAGVKSFSSVDESTTTITLLLAAAGYQYTMVGCRARGPRVQLLPNRPGLLTFTVVGRLSADPVEAAITGLSLNSVVPPVWRDATVTIGAWGTTTAAPNQLVPRRLEIETNTDTPARPSAGAGGLAGHAITNRTMRAIVEVEPVALATFNPYTAAMERAGAVSRAISTTIGPGADGNSFGIVTGDWAIEQPEMSDSDGYAVIPLAGDLVARSHANGREADFRYS